MKLDPAPQQVCIFCICFVNVLFINPYVLASIPMFYDTIVISFIFVLVFTLYFLLQPTLMIVSSVYY